MMSCPGLSSFRSFQDSMKQLQVEAQSRPIAQNDLSMGAQLMRVLREAGLQDERIHSEIGILFVEGFEVMLAECVRLLLLGAPGGINSQY
jgi:hypothetical protein